MKLARKSFLLSWMRSRLFIAVRILKVLSRSGDGSVNQETREHPLLRALTLLSLSPLARALKRWVLSTKGGRKLLRCGLGIRTSRSSYNTANRGSNLLALRLAFRFFPSDFFLSFYRTPVAEKKITGTKYRVNNKKNYHVESVSLRARARADVARTAFVYTRAASSHYRIRCG